MRRIFRTVLIGAWVIFMVVLSALGACERPGGSDGEATRAELAPLDVELVLTESSVAPDGQVGQSHATLTLEGRTATLSWSHTGALATGGVAPPSGTLELTDDQVERLHKILEKTALGQRDIERLETVADQHVRLAGKFDDGAHALDIQLDTARPLTERPPTDDDAVFAIEAARALIGEVARFLNAEP